MPANPLAHPHHKHVLQTSNIIASPPRVCVVTLRISGRSSRCTWVRELLPSDAEENVVKPLLALALTIGLLVGLATLAAWGNGPPAVQAHGGSVRYVAPTGADVGDCADPGHPCATVQYAVDQATWGDEVHIATGVYTDVHQRAGITQMVYISKTVSLRGGYPAGFSGPPDPDAHPTTLDAQGRGRVLYIIGAISPSVEGLRITGGNAAGLGGTPWGDDAGGGVYVLTSTVIIRCNLVFSNTAWYGGGLYLQCGTATFSENIITTNTADKCGGGLYSWSSAVALDGNTVTTNAADSGGGLLLYASTATLHRNIIISNTAYSSGGGLFLVGSDDGVLDDNTITANTANDGGGLRLWYSAAMLNDNTISMNAANLGGGLFLSGSDVVLSGNVVTTNTAGYGGGLCSMFSAATFNDNTITANVAHYSGGGLCLLSSPATLYGNIISANIADYHGGGLFLADSKATLTNNVVADNQARTAGSGLYIAGSAPHLRHTTIARNTGGDGSGIHIISYVSGAYYSSTVALTNTILVSQTVGITITGGNTVTVNGILWHDTPITVSHAATATVTVQNQRWGDPAFVNPAAGDYHIGPASAARDAGIDAGVHSDIDGEPRPYQLPDMGADEYWPPGALRRLYLPLVWRS